MRGSLLTLFLALEKSLCIWIANGIGLAKALLCAHSLQNMHTHTHACARVREANIGVSQTNIDWSKTAGSAFISWDHDDTSRLEGKKQTKKKNMRKTSQRQCCYVWSSIKLTSENWHASWYGAFVLETAPCFFRFLHNDHKPQFLWLCLTRERLKPLKISGLPASVSFCVKRFSVWRYEVNRLFQWNREAIIVVEQTN